MHASCASCLYRRRPLMLVSSGRSMRCGQLNWLSPCTKRSTSHLSQHWPLSSSRNVHTHTLHTHTQAHTCTHFTHAHTHMHVHTHVHTPPHMYTLQHTYIPPYLLLLPCLSLPSAASEETFARGKGSTFAVSSPTLPAITKMTESG